VHFLNEENDDTLRGKADIARIAAIEYRQTRRLTENERMLIETIQTLDSKYPNLIVIVEGKHDATVLRNLGLQAPIIKTQTRLPRHRLIEKIEAMVGKDGQVLILTDFDKKGKEIHRFIQKELEISGVKSLKRERRMIRKYMDNWICIEQLVSLFKKRDSPEASRH